MQRKKRGLWLFLFSLIPGAGEMYMGFQKQGISIMLLFWSILGVSAWLGMGWLMLFLPVLWFYSFFNVHNLKVMPDEEFYALEDNYILSMEQLFDTDGASAFFRYRKVIAILLIVFGLSILWNNFSQLLFWILPDFMTRAVSEIMYRIPQIIVALLIILGGLCLLSGRKKKLEQEDSSSYGEHYWEPYRPYRQAQETTDAIRPEQENVNSAPSSNEDSAKEPEA